jgi:hypothetical protein
MIANPHTCYRRTLRTTIVLEALRALAHHRKVAPVTPHQRVDFAAGKVDGRTVGGLTPQALDQRGGSGMAIRRAIVT